MRRLGAWGGAAALLLGLGLAVARADEPHGEARTTTAKSGWWSGWFGDKTAAKAKDTPKTEKTAPAEEQPAPVRSPESTAAEQKRQMNAYLRRVEVCLRLRQIAEQTGSAELQRQAEEMDARAWDIYRQQTAQLPASEAMPDLESKPALRKPIRKPAAPRQHASNGGEGEPAAAAKPMPRARQGAEPLGGDFEQRERNLINGTFMGRDRP